MRLTLRTLLAWLDDTLPPTEVRQIGQQVTESKVAQDLVDKIHLVTRQRRLTVPPSTGPDATDPNEVAGYLDSTLSPDDVAEYEKKCLTSDVHLAEVASCHQILSMIGQRAKVPAEARHRMYHLVRGREAVGAEVPRAFSPPAPEAVTPPVKPWATPLEIPKRPWLEQYGPLAAVLGLVVVLIWSAWASLRPASTSDSGPLVAGGPNSAPARKPAAPVGAAKPDDAGDESAKAPNAAKGDENPPAKPEDDAEKEKGAEPAATLPDLPAGAVGAVGAEEAVLLRYNAEKRTWGLLKPKASLQAGDRVVNLPPLRGAISLGPDRLTFASDAEVRLQKPEGETAPRFEFVHGRVVLRGATPAAPIAVQFANGVLRITPPAGGLVGIERLARPGVGEPPTATLRVIVPDGEATVAVAEGKTETLTGPASIEYQAPGTLNAKAAEPAPAWVSESAPPPVDQELGKALARFFKDDRPPITSLLEAREDPQKDIRRFAVIGMAAIDQPDMVVETLSAPNDSTVRRASIHVLRELANRDAASARALYKLLEQKGGSKEWADNVERLLRGLNPREADDEMNLSNLVKLLKHEDVGVRELALDNLQALSERGESLNYDPDKPDGDGLRAWQDLLERKEIRKAAAARKGSG